MTASVSLVYISDERARVLLLPFRVAVQYQRWGRLRGQRVLDLRMWMVTVEFTGRPRTRMPRMP